MKNLILLAITVIAMSACSAKKDGSVIFESFKHTKQNKPIKAKSTDNMYDYGQGCLYRNRDSLTCTTRRVQAQLRTLELNINNITTAVGSCESCTL